MSYLRSVGGLSLAAVDYISLILNLETNLFTSLLESIRDMLIINDSTKFYRIQGGSDLLINAMINECLTIEQGRCSLLLNTEVTQVQLYASEHVRIVSSNSSNNSNLFDSVIVATTATAAQLIDFRKRADFSDKYRVMRQLHYDCSSKILLFFNSSWWYNNENINGGRSITDLPSRFIYYPKDSNINGGVILASYSWSQDSLLWQSLSDDDAMELALQNLMEIHPTTGSSMRQFLQGGTVKHWCEDEYVRGAFALFTPLQETDISEILKASVSNIHFIGEHTSSAHAWVEGALLSSLRSALTIQEEIYDVVIIGGGPIGLATAVYLALKQPTLSIAVIEQGNLLNSDGSSGTFDQRQFRQMYNEIYLAELANLSVPLWEEIEQLANLSRGSILNTNDGYLFYGDFNSPETVEGDLASIQRTCDLLQMGCVYLNNTELQTRYPFFKFSSNYQGLFHSQSGYINVTTLMNALLRIIEQNPRITLRQNEEFISIDKINYTHIVTSRGSIRVKHKTLFVPGPFAKNISHLLGFDLNITIWEMPYVNFRLRPNATQIPTWFAWAAADLQSLFSGFSIDPTSDYIFVVASFIQNLSNPLLYPAQRTNIANPFIIKKIIDFVAQNLTQVDPNDYFVKNRTCLATFLPDNGFLLDYVPNTNQKVLIQAAGWGMKFVPIWADILSDMILLESSNDSSYAKYLPYFSLSRPYRLITNTTQISSNEPKKFSFFFYYLIILSFVLILFKD
jgi:glycine/D-amino acid oxidase-like deaminating enzyme